MLTKDSDGIAQADYRAIEQEVSSHVQHQPLGHRTYPLSRRVYVRHMMIANVKGRFSEVEGEVIGDPHDLTGATIQVSINTASVDTRVADRDNHLRSADFFDSENYPQMTFKSTKITKTGEGEYRIDGELTIRDVTNPITLEATFEGGQGPLGRRESRFQCQGQAQPEGLRPDLERRARDRWSPGE